MKQNSKYYKYNLKKVMYTVFHLNSLNKRSKETFEKYSDYCWNYPRISDYAKELDEPIIVNSYEAHIKDLKWKEMSLTTFKAKDIKKLNLKLLLNQLKAILYLKILSLDIQKNQQS